MISAVLATYLAQAVASLVTAALLCRFWRLYRRGYLLLWCLCWAMLATHQIAAGAVYQIAQAFPDANHPLRLSLSILSITCSTWHIVFLLAGTRMIVRGVDQRQRSIIAWLVGTGVFCISAALATAIVDHTEFRRLIRIGLPVAISSVGFMVMAILLLSAKVAIKGIATRLLGFTALIYAFGQIASLVLFLGAVFAAAVDFNVPLAEFSTLTNFLLQSVLALGMVVWLLEVERDQAAATAEALGEREHRLRGLFQSAVDPLWDWDVQNDRSTFSPSWRRLINWPDDATDDQRPRWEDLLHPDDRDRVLRCVAESLRSDDVPYEVEYRIRTFAGDWKWVLSRGRVATRDRHGQALRMVGNITDITERKAHETSLRESEERLRAVIETTPGVAIQGYDLAGRVLFWNRAAEKMFGWSEQETIGRTLDALMLDDAGARAFTESLQEIDRTGEPVTMNDTPFTRRDGTQGWCISTIFRIPGGPAPTFICMDVDITERKQAEHALEHSNGLQRLLLSELDHRVRNNLASLTALIDLTSGTAVGVREFAESIRKRVQAMAVVHSLLSREHWQSVDLQQLALTLAPVGSQQSLVMRGPAVKILPRQATALGMVLQELFANSQKYGSLSRDSGTLELEWSCDEPGTHCSMLRLLWRERGGPDIDQPVDAGVGTGLIHGLVRTELAGEADLRYEPHGATHELLLRLDTHEHHPRVPHIAQHRDSAMTVLL